MNDSVDKSATPQKPAGRNPYTLWLVVIAFVAPVLLAYGLYFLGISPPAYNNNGELLNPILDVGEFALSNGQGEVIAREDITQHKWQLVYFAGSHCDEACNKTLLNLRQINKAVGKNEYRLRRLIVHLDQADETFLALINSEYPEALHAYAERDVILSALAPVNPDIASNEVYLIDPLGNIMMRFSSELGFKDVLHDLNKLFKVSQIG